VLKRLEAAKTRFGPDADFSLFCLDIDGFKGVNDAFGHAVGDELLQGVARRLGELCRSVPSATVARMSGDEFVILFEGARTSQELVLSSCAVAILHAMREPILVGDLKLTVGVSIGIAIASKNGAHDILRRADVALYRVKESGRGHYCFFEPQMDQARETRRGIMIDLGLALAQDQFTLNFQPLVGAHSFKVEGFEALLRWSHPSRGVVSPAEFIPLAEESGAIFAVGEWVLRHACLAAITWPRHVRVAVNVSPIQLRHSDFADIVASVLKSTRLSADRLELEVTESVFLDYNWITEQNLQRLRALGVRLSLDDFGTGYSSLNYLRKIAFDKVKIDQAFVRGLPAATDLVIVKAVVEIALSRGMAVVAEGVETAEQRDCLRAQGCAQFQGYLFSAPLSEEDAALFLESNTQSTSAAKAA
jgi:diguanylate cyclase (GGDEF)-like protein